jgi:hypothetical protein
MNLCIGASALGLDCGDDRVRFLCRAAIVNQDVCPGLGERQGNRAADSSGCSGYQRSFVLKRGHCPFTVAVSVPEICLSGVRPPVYGQICPGDV